MQNLFGILPLYTSVEQLAPALAIGYDPVLVTLSVVVALFAAYTALGLSTPIATCGSPMACASWLVAGAVAMGGGVWAMHFIGMLAYRVPVAVGYQAGGTLASVVPAVLAGGVMLYVVSRSERRTPGALVLGGVFMGAGIGVMHYTGMAAMRLHGAVMRYDLTMVVVSVVVAVVLACIAIFVHHMAFHRTGIGRKRVRLVAGLIMGLAIAGMHYTAMAGVSVHVTGDLPARDAAASSTLLGLAAALVTGLIMVLAAIAVVVERAMQAVRHGRDRFESLVQLSPDMICIVQGGVFTFVNPAGARVLAVDDGGALLGRRLIDFIHADYAALFENGDMLDELAAIGEPLPVMMHTDQGDPLEMNMSISRIDSTGGDTFFLEFHDVTQRKKSTLDLLNREQRIKAIMDHAADGIITMGADGNVETMNAAAVKIFRCVPTDVVGTPFCKLMDESCQDVQVGRSEAMALRSDGFIFPVDMAISDVKIGGERKFIAIVRDITNRKQTEDQMVHMANHDIVTNLPNRLALQGYLNASTSNDEGGAVLFVAIDKHKRINDTLGHDYGEKLLTVAGERIQKAIDDCGLVGFWSAGEYVVVVPNISQKKEVERLSGLILDAVQEPFEIKGHELNVGADIGVSFYPEDSRTPYVLVKNAGQAMFAGREEGSWPCHYFTAEMAAKAAERHKMETAMRTAVERDEFQVFYQPKIDLKTGHIGGMEALIRWQSPDLGFVSPAAFIPLAEETGLIVPIGEWVFKTACRDTKAWHDKGYGALRVAINLSGRQFESEGLLDFIRDTINDIGIDPEKIELEVTESALMRDVEEGLRVLEELRDIGITVAIDDFGTGYSSLGYLKQLPVDTLKIDQSFVRHIDTDEGDAAIASTIVGMAQNLKLKVVAEGIETLEHEGLLIGLKCDIGQGYYYAKPLPRDEFTDFLSRRAVSAA